MSEKEPRICDMVVYTHPSAKDRSQPNLKSPAVVLQVRDDDKLDLNVFWVTGGSMYRQGVEQGNGEYEWSWPRK